MKDLYGCITTCQLRDGSSVLFWKDSWGGECVTDLLPNLAHFVKHLDLSVKQVCSASYLKDLFHIPVSQAAVDELHDLRVLIQSFELTNESGIRVFFWGNSLYKAASLYMLGFSHYAVPDCWSGNPR